MRLPDDEKSLAMCFDTILACDRQTDEQTDGIFSLMKNIAR